MLITTQALPVLPGY